MTNDDIARKLRAHANELARSGENLYRVRAFRQAALAILRLHEEVIQLVARGGRRSLAQLPGVGDSLAETIEVYARSGIWSPRRDLIPERHWNRYPTCGSVALGCALREQVRLHADCRS